MKKSSFFCFFAILIAISYIFRSWFLNKEIIGGDWPYIFDETLRNYSFYFSSWNPFRGNGLGGMNPFYSLGVFHGFTVFLSQTFNLSWPFTYKFFWFGLFIGLSIFSSIYLLKTVLPRAKIYQQIIAAMIFTTNTYILMVVSGGQMGVALSYAIAPLVLASFIKVTDVILSSSLNIKYTIIAGLILAVQVMFDPRVAYLTMIVVGVYIFFSTAFIEFSAKKIFSFFLSLMFFGLGLPVLVTGLLHAAWILPALFLQSSPIPQGLTSVAGFSFFSFADFSHAFSLLHPNWPENIFGKTYFMKAEFIFLPIIAYSSLLFFRLIAQKDAEHNVEKRRIIFLVLLGLVGAFLTKGANPPFGGINTFLFEHIPGMNMFRDPTKFYLLVALSYSILIPYSLGQFVRVVLSIKYKVLSIHNTYYIIPATFLVIWAFLIRPAIFGELGGTFKEGEVPPEYVKLKDFLHSQPGFFRILWIPRQHRFTYYSLTHLPVEAQPLFKKAKVTDIISELRKSGTEKYLSELGIKYIIVPYDPYGEIFVKDRKYDALAYGETIRKIEAIPWLRKIDGFGRIAVFETSAFKDYFFLTGDGRLTYNMSNVTNYSISVDINNYQHLIFAENYNPYWAMKINNRIIRSEKTLNGLNSFVLEKGKYNFEIVFLQDQFYIYGRIISVAALAAVLLFFWKKRKDVILPR